MKKKTQSEQFLRQSTRVAVLFSVKNVAELFNPEADWKPKKAAIEAYFRSKEVCCDFIWTLPRIALPVYTLKKIRNKFCSVSEKFIVSPLNARSNKYANRPCDILINFSEGYNGTAEGIAERSAAPIKVCITDKPDSDSSRLKKYNMVLLSEDFGTKGFDAYFPVLTMLLQSLN
ncbi:MAG: hypothetical protein HUJ95_02440 [Bacteroidales bacterium]|nr:hypothetical protein [Bacteroidales bacterium]